MSVILTATELIILWVVFAKYFCNVQILRCFGQGFWSKSLQPHPMKDKLQLDWKEDEI